MLSWKLKWTVSPRPEAFSKELETMVKMSRPLGAGSRVWTLGGSFYTSLQPGNMDLAGSGMSGVKGFEKQCDRQYCPSGGILLK